MNNNLQSVATLMAIKSKQKLVKQISLFALACLAVACNKDDDSANDPDETSIEITVADLTASIAENPTADQVIGQIEASANTDDTLSYTITNQSVAGAVSLDLETGELRVAEVSAFDFETNTELSGSFEVSAADGTETASFTITITDTNEFAMLDDASFEVAEDLADDAVINAFMVEDPDGDTLSYSIMEDTSDLFEISASGELSIQSGKSLDFETTSSHEILIKVADSELEDTATITINVTDVNDAPTIGSAAYDVDENVEGFQILGILDFSDAETDNEELVLSLVSGDDVLFGVGDDGEIFLKSDQSLDFEAQSTYTIMVEVSDGELASETEITINVNNVNERPELTEPTIAVDEDICYRTFEYNILAEDPEDDTITFTLVTNDNDLFTLSESGVLRLADNQSLDFATSSGHFLNIRIEDGELSTLTGFIVGVNEVTDRAICFPDANFENALLSHSPSVDINNDGKIQVSEAENYDEFLFLRNQNISDLSGIEHFINLESLNVSVNNLETLDLSALNALDTLVASNNNLSDVIPPSTTTVLQSADLRSNNLSGSFDFSSYTNLVVVQLDENDLTSIGISGLGNLQVLTVSDNDLTALNTSGNTFLTTLHVHNNNISSLDLSASGFLIELRCQNNTLTTLDITANTQVTYLDCSDNLISTLDLVNNTELRQVFIMGNQMSGTIDVRNADNLEEFFCNNNLLNTIWINNGNNTNITGFGAGGNSTLNFVYVDDVSYSIENWTDIDDPESYTFPD
jgi:hypothetical protein